MILGAPAYVRGRFLSNDWKASVKRSVDPKIESGACRSAVLDRLVVAIARRYGGDLDRGFRILARWRRRRLARQQLVERD